MAPTSNPAARFSIAPSIVAEILKPAAYASGAVHDQFAWLRKNNPLGFASLDGFDPFWVVTRHSDILEISRQNKLFHSGDRSVLMMDAVSIRKTVEQTGSPNMVRNVVSMDSPEHEKYRRITQAWFTPSHVKRREERIRTIARTMISGMIERGNQCDFVAEIGIWYPLRVVMEILGIPAEHDRLMLKLTQEMLGVEDSELGRERKSVFADDFLDVVRDFHSYFREVLAARRRNPGDDVASVIANAEIDGQLIDDASVLGYYTAIATAGHDTTSSSTASAVWALANYPEEFRRVKADRSQIPTLVNEAIRWSTPVQHFMRSATADCEILGRPIAKGDWLMLNYFSGNRDEEVFGDPFTFRGNRDPNPHLSFGYGVHLCLGMNLARLEIKILLEELLDRIEHIELAGTVRRSESLFIAGLKTLPVNYRAS